MDDLIAFLNARYDEDEKIAGEPRCWSIGHHECDTWGECDRPCPDAASCAGGLCWHRTVTGSDGMMIYDEGGHSEAEAEHIARHDPARVVREVGAGRAEIALYRELAAEYESSHHGADMMRRDALATVLRHRAGIWCDHRDYKAEWGLPA